MAEIWGAAIVAAVGVGTTLYGTNAQKKANQAAASANAEAQDKQNNAAWSNWLMSRGVAPTTPVEAGVMPSAGGYSAVNTKLPIWANVNFGTSVPGQTGSGIRLVKKGAPRTTGITGLAPTPPPAPVKLGEPVTVPNQGSGGRSLGSKLLDPIGLFS